MATDETIADILTEISDSYPMFELTESRVKVWKKYLSQYDDDLLRNALEHYINTSTKSFPPSIPELRNAVTELKILIAGIPLPFQAWEDLRNAYPPHKVWFDKIDPETGQSEVVVEEKVYTFMHPVVERVAIMLGWPDKFPKSDEIGVDRAHFIKAYEQAIGAAANMDRESPQVREFVLEQRQSGVPLIDLGRDVEKSVKNVTRILEAKK